MPAPTPTEYQVPLTRGVVTIKRKGEDRWEAATGYTLTGVGETPQAALTALRDLHRSIAEDMTTVLDGWGD